jgi:hypothetical protein
MDQRIRNSRQGTAKGRSPLSPDLVTISLTVHGAVLGAATVALFKLGGESKFGTEKVSDLQSLRPKLLKGLVESLELNLRPALVIPNATEPLLYDATGNPLATPAKLSVTGREALTNVVRDFVKSDSPSLLDLRAAHFLEDSLNSGLDHLRNTVWMLWVTTGIICLLMAIGKFGWLKLDVGWIHGIAFAVVVGLLGYVGWLCLRILNAASRVDRLKTRYVDL